MGKYSLEEILEEVITYGPAVVRELHTRLWLNDAESLVSILRRDYGWDVEVYDFPGTLGVWDSTLGDEVPYSHLATKELIKTLAEQLGVDYRTFEGFKQILPHLSYETLSKSPINKWKTKLSGMRYIYNCSPSAQVLDLVMNDDEFAEIKKRNLQPYDFPNVPLFTWTDKSGNPTDTARQATKQLIKTLAEQQGVDYTTFRGFRQILPYLTVDTFTSLPINDWGTTLNVLLKVYGGGPSAAVLDLIEKDKEFARIKKLALHPHDFSKSPLNTWIDKDGNPTETSRHTTKQLIKTLAKRRKVDYTVFDGFVQLLPDLTADTFENTPINRWGTRLPGMLMYAYNDSPPAAVLDLVNTDEEFRNLRGVLTLDMLTRNPARNREEYAQAVHAS